MIGIMTCVWIVIHSSMTRSFFVSTKVGRLHIQSSSSIGDGVVALSESTAYQHHPQDIDNHNEGMTLDTTRTISQRGYGMRGAQVCSSQAEAEKEDCICTDWCGACRWPNKQHQQQLDGVNS